MVEKGMHGSFVFASYLWTFQRAKSESEKERKIDKPFGLMR